MLTEWNTEAVAARSAAGSAEGSWELSTEAVLCDLIIVLCVSQHSTPVLARLAQPSFKQLSVRHTHTQIQTRL